MLKIFGLFCVTCAIIAGDVKADQLGQLREEYNNVVKECMAEYPLTQADIEALGTKKTTENVNCMFACALKKSGMMDDNGNLSVEGVRKSTEKYLSNDSELLKKSEMFTDACKSVNDVPVSDGKKGCERASLIFQCSIEKAPSFELF